MNLPGAFTDTRLAAPGEGMGRSIDHRDGQLGDRLDFGKLLNILRRRLILIILVIAGFLVVGGLLTMMQSRVYEANAFVLLKQSGQQLEERVTQTQGQQQMQGDADVSTEVQVIASLDLARRVITNFNLVEDPRVNPWLDPKPSLFGRLLGNKPDPIDIASLTPTQRGELENRLVQVVRAGLGAERVGTAYTVRILYRHSDPEVSALLANAFASEYAQWQVARKKEETAAAADFLASKVEELREQATSDFAAVQSFRVSNGLLSNSATALAEQDISVYNQQTAIARAEAAADAARLSTARRQLRDGSTGDDVGEALSSSVVSALRTQRAQIGARVADLSTRYGERHPDLLRAREELASVDRQIQDEIDRVISNLEARAAVSSGRLSSLNSSLGSARGELARNNSALVELEDLRQRAEASQGLYESYLARYREVMAGSGTEQPEARVLAEALVPSSPVSPKVALNMILAAMCGVLFGVIAALVAELQYKGLTTAEDVEKQTGLPYLGLAPDNASLSHPASTPLGTLTEQPNSILAESIRAIHAATYLPIGGRGQVVAVTSALPGEGKTVLSAMLGRTAAESGDRTVIVDCDIILRGLSKLHEMNEGPGVREIAARQVLLEDALRYEEGGNLAILPITSDAEAGERLTRSGSIHAIIAQLKERFDLIVLDCPPLLAIAEAREIAGLADGVILAVHWRKTSSEAVRLASRMLPARLANYIGVVLTRVDLRKQSRYANDDTAAYAGAYQTYLTAAS